MYFTMKQEIDVAVDLLCAYIQRYGTAKEESIELFRLQLGKALLDHYRGHWYPDKPTKGQAYRSLEFNKENDFCDTIVGQVCGYLNFTPSLLGIRHELTLWIDPYEVSIRLGNHVCPKDNQQIIVARFDKDGNEIMHNDLDGLLSQSRIPMVNPSRTSPTNSSPCDSVSNSGSSTPQRTSSPFSVAQQSMFRNDPLFTPPRALSPQAPAFQMFSSAPISVPFRGHPLENSINIDDRLLMEGNHSQPERSDTPHSMNSTTSNESSDSGYCGYVESYPYYYKLNRLYKALAIQKCGPNPSAVRKTQHTRRVPRHIYQQQQTIIMPTNFSTSPTTPTPMNIDQLAPFYEEPPFYPISTGAIGSRKSKY
ncbi:unnamed protein product [Rotaria socialis]|uniref:Anti-proliferative protein domain-containing protein n=2 Tax=Rotaria socialis TaxID=392032 RepID=A0A817R962_9BILA|nr:unnamed protein product [Rotaria socialis]CAF3316602.1 unnamed protein product [Rotaria socialis]CAF3457693.1 unnamed protein product [Rotaria socialis]CAF4165441.1 unnamed protein product [Rotaria socialis]CAF4360713.1 unnamed protein product [Rotaria socialis]